MALAEPAIAWRRTEDAVTPYLRQADGTERDLQLAPLPGSQTAFLACPIFECLLEGNRGGGKTQTLLLDFLQHVGKGWGPNWRGLLFRRAYPELEDVIAKSKAIFWTAFPEATYNEAKSFWQFPEGERLYFRQFAKHSDYYKYHGHSYTWIGWEELTTWPDAIGYKSMMSCARSAIPGIPIKVRATTNPYGVGHNWVKRRFRLPIGGRHVVGKVIEDDVDDEDNPEPPRVAIHSSLRENIVLLAADPRYIDRIRASARNKAQMQAWIDGSWDIVAGGMFDDVWDEKVHIVRPFPIPAAWTLDRSFDWGSARPFSVGWWAESNGEDVKLPDGSILKTIKGDLFRVAEWYGWNGRENEGCGKTAPEIAKGVKEREAKMFPGRTIRPGPADNQIFGDGKRDSQGETVAAQMKKKGVTWLVAQKGPGSRKAGCEQVRNRMKCAKPVDEKGNPLPREEPGLFIFSICEHFKRTVPVLPRSDNDLDDIDDEAEDHCFDDVRYKIFRKKSVSERVQIRGR